jgi:hypothetical protein
MPDSYLYVISNNTLGSDSWTRPLGRKAGTFRPGASFRSGFYRMKRSRSRGRPQRTLGFLTETGHSNGSS